MPTESTQLELVNLAHGIELLTQEVRLGMQGIKKQVEDLSREAIDLENRLSKTTMDQEQRIRSLESGLKEAELALEKQLSGIKIKLTILALSGAVVGGGAGELARMVLGG